MYKCSYSTITSQTSTIVIADAGFQLTLGRAWKLVRKTLTHAYNNLGDNYKHGYGDYEDGQEWITLLRMSCTGLSITGKDTDLSITTPNVGKERGLAQH